MALVSHRQPQYVLSVDCLSLHSTVMGINNPVFHFLSNQDDVSIHWTLIMWVTFVYATFDTVTSQVNDIQRPTHDVKPTELN